jgi:hypothetical protein
MLHQPLRQRPNPEGTGEPFMGLVGQTPLQGFIQRFPYLG